MALVCENCGKTWADASSIGSTLPGGPYKDTGVSGAGWWQVGKQLTLSDGTLAPFLSLRHDFCTETCLRAFYARQAGDAVEPAIPSFAPHRELLGTFQPGTDPPKARR